MQNADSNGSGSSSTTLAESCGRSEVQIFEGPQSQFCNFLVHTSAIYFNVRNIAEVRTNIAEVRTNIADAHLWECVGAGS